MTDSAFFQRRQAAAVLKHEVVGRYVRVFTTMTGTTSPDRRVVYLDGYAGRGAYEDGSPGSPLVALDTAQAVAGWDRKVDCVFVEADHANYTELERHLRDRAPNGPEWRVWHGDVANLLDDALALAAGLPLLAFLDPFGSALGYDALADKLLARPGRSPTEVLLNLNVQQVQRWGGLLRQRARNAGQEGLLARLDRFFGGPWWRDAYLAARGGDSSPSDAALAVVDEFRQKIHARTGHHTFCVPVRRRPGHLPLFLLVLFYREPVAPWKFNEAASSANQRWRAFCRDADLAARDAESEGQLDIFAHEIPTYDEEQAVETERRLELEWTQEISANLKRMAAAQAATPLRDRINEVYGITLGQARDKHVRKAWDELVDKGIVLPRNKRLKLYKDVVVSARP